MRSIEKNIKFNDGIFFYRFIKFFRTHILLPFHLLFSISAKENKFARRNVSFRWENCSNITGISNGAFVFDIEGSNEKRGQTCVKDYSKHMKDPYDYQHMWKILERVRSMHILASFPVEMRNYSRPVINARSPFYFSYFIISKKCFHSKKNYLSFY